jgi:hypothetical protein
VALYEIEWESYFNSVKDKICWWPKIGQKPNYKELIFKVVENMHAAAAKDAQRSQLFPLRPLCEKKYTVIGK